MFLFDFSVYLPALTACIDPHRESCKGDPVLDAILPMESGLITQCQNMGGGPGGKLILTEFIC
jgi:hypothetical protein